MPENSDDSSIHAELSSDVTLSVTQRDDRDAKSCDADGCADVDVEVPDRKCLRFDPETFPSMPTLLTYFPFGRLGNTISAYLVNLLIVEPIECGNTCVAQRGIAWHSVA